MRVCSMQTFQLFSPAVRQNRFGSPLKQMKGEFYLLSIADFSAFVPTHTCVHLTLSKFIYLSRQGRALNVDYTQMNQEIFPPVGKIICTANINLAEVVGNFKSADGPLGYF